ncbi:MAG: ABC-F family ATP-binding cassette domain-containing protein, partial [Deltaproteobacteria bacterium]|nr:ABC-F family ATP-binding cassette domain-containing protein [Deltaproteobacteria bacterium]
MSLLVLQNGTLGFGGQRIFDDANLRIGEGERIGLVGPNGSGKSTLLKVLLGIQHLDSGDLVRARGLRLGYLPQDVLELAGATLLHSILATVPGRGDIEERVHAAEDALTQSDDPDEQMVLATKLSELNERLDHFETHYNEREAIRIALGLGFSESDLPRPTAEFSGGWKMRAALAGLLFQQPDILLLDEPTNHLDVPSVLWIEGFLAAYRNAIVLISHDREFLNRHARRIVALEPEGLRSYRGNYDAYIEQHESESDVREANQRNQERELKELERFVDRFRAKATKARQAQSRARRVKRLQKEMAENRPLAARRTLAFTFPEVPRTGRDVLTLDGVSKAFGDLSLYEAVTHGVYAGDRVAIVGVNGAGKTTLLK